MHDGSFPVRISKGIVGNSVCAEGFFTVIAQCQTVKGNLANVNPSNIGWTVCGQDLSKPNLFVNNRRHGQILLGPDSMRNCIPLLSQSQSLGNGKSELDQDDHTQYIRY